MKNVESDNNKILYETLLDFLQRNGTYFLNKPRIQEEIKNSLKTGNVSSSSVQNRLFSSLLPNNIKIKGNRTVILPVFCMGVKLGRSH